MGWKRLTRWKYNFCATSPKTSRTSSTLNSKLKLPQNSCTFQKRKYLELIHLVCYKSSSCKRWKFLSTNAHSELYDSIEWNRIPNYKIRSSAWEIFRSANDEVQLVFCGLHAARTPNSTQLRTHKLYFVEECFPRLNSSNNLWSLILLGRLRQLDGCSHCPDPKSTSTVGFKVCSLSGVRPGQEYVEYSGKRNGHDDHFRTHLADPKFLQTHPDYGAPNVDWCKLTTDRACFLWRTHEPSQLPANRL